MSMADTQGEEIEIHNHRFRVTPDNERPRVWTDVDVVDSPTISGALLEQEGRRNWSLYFTDEETNTQQEVAEFREFRDGSLRLYHLEIPRNMRGAGCGASVVGVFRTLGSVWGYESFSMKFGGGDESQRFLKSVGFPEEYVGSVREECRLNPSAVVGVVLSDGSESPWELSAVPFDVFPEIESRESPHQ